MVEIKPDYTLKILTIGESAVGKTCILLRFTDDKFLINHITTIGIDFKAKEINCDDKKVKLKIWDTAGQERFRNITKQYYKGADGILLVYDITDRNSFEKVRDWMKQIQENTQRDAISVVLIGNKCDLEDRQVSFEEGERISKEFGIQFLETSAYKDINIKQSFEALSQMIISKKAPDQKKINSVIPNNPNKPNKGGCC